MEINDGAVEVLEEYAKNLMALGQRFMVGEHEGGKYLDIKKIKTNKHKRRILLMWVGEIIDAVLDDLRYGESKDLAFKKALREKPGIKLRSETDFETISLVNILAFEILDLLNDQIDETDHSLSIIKGLRKL